MTCRYTRKVRAHMRVSSRLCNSVRSCSHVLLLVLLFEISVRSIDSVLFSRSFKLVSESQIELPILAKSSTQSNFAADFVLAASAFLATTLVGSSSRHAISVSGHGTARGRLGLRQLERGLQRPLLRSQGEMDSGLLTSHLCTSQLLNWSLFRSFEVPFVLLTSAI